CSFHFIMLPRRPYFSMRLADAIAALAGALGAFDPQHVELALNVTEDEKGARQLALRSPSVRSLHQASGDPLAPTAFAFGRTKGLVPENRSCKAKPMVRERCPAKTTKPDHWLGPTASLMMSLARQGLWRFPSRSGRDQSLRPGRGGSEE